MKDTSKVKPIYDYWPCHPRVLLWTVIPCVAIFAVFGYVAPAMNKDAAENKYPPVARDLMKAHDSVVERTQEVPDGTGNLRTFASSIGTGANCITVIQLYQAKSSFYYLGHPVFRNEPDQIQMIPCSSPK